MTPHVASPSSPSFALAAALAGLLLLSTGCRPTPPTQVAGLVRPATTRPLLAGELNRVRTELGRQSLGRMFLTATHPTGLFAAEGPVEWSGQTDGRLSGRVQVVWVGASGSRYETVYAFAVGGGPAAVSVASDTARVAVSYGGLSSARHALQQLADRLAAEQAVTVAGRSTDGSSPTPEARRQSAEASQAIDDIHLAQAMAAVWDCQKGKYDEAIATFDSILRRDTAHVYALNGRGYAYARKGDLARAFTDLDESVRLKPDWAPTYRLRGQVLALGKDYRAAVSEYAHAIRLDPRADGALIGLGWEESTVYLERGMSRLILGELDGAVDDFNDEVRLNPSSADAYTWRAVAFDKAGRGDLARADRATADRLRAERTK